MLNLSTFYKQNRTKMYSFFSRYYKVKRTCHSGSNSANFSGIIAVLGLQRFSGYPLLLWLTYVVYITLYDNQYIRLLFVCLSCNHFHASWKNIAIFFVPGNVICIYIFLHLNDAFILKKWNYETFDHNMFMPCFFLLSFHLLFSFFVHTMYRFHFWSHFFPKIIICLLLIWHVLSFLSVFFFLMRSAFNKTAIKENGCKRNGVLDLKHTKDSWNQLLIVLCTSEDMRTFTHTLNDILKPHFKPPIYVYNFDVYTFLCI